MLKAFINFNLATDRTDIWIVDERPDGLRRVFQPVQLVSQVVDLGVAMDPTISLPREAAGQLLRSIMEEIQRAGIQPPDAGKIEGELEATKKHLEDVREWFGTSLKTILARPVAVIDHK